MPQMKPSMWMWIMIMVTLMMMMITIMNFFQPYQKKNKTQPTSAQIINTKWK